MICYKNKLIAYILNCITLLILIFFFYLSVVASSGKGLRNLFEGSYLNLGNYDQCLSIRSSKLNLNATSDSSSNTTNFHGKYCLMSIVPQPSLLTSFGTNDSVKRSEFSDPTLNVSQKIDVLFRFRQQIHSKVAFCLPSTCTDQDVKVLINSGRHLFDITIFDFWFKNFIIFVECIPMVPLWYTNR